MKLLILTQKIDRDDDVLGFFHGWVEDFSKQFESVVVVCLEKRVYSFAENVKVYSLGKPDKGWSALGAERYAGKLKALFNFYTYTWRERKNYDVVFVHMNQEYVLLGGILWRLAGKKVLLWYNHTVGTFLTRVAAWLSHKVLHTSPFAFTAQFKNSRRMPAGIDVKRFKIYDSVLKNNEILRILYIGRISPLKGIHILLNAVKLLNEKNTPFKLDVYGNAPKKDKKYFERLKNDASNLVDKGVVSFKGSVPNSKTPEIYNQHDVFVNLTPRGNFDKTILEAMACETLVVVSSKAFEDLLPPEFLCKENNPGSLSENLEHIFKMPIQEKIHHTKEMREAVVKKHRLEKLTTELFQLCLSL